MNPTILSRLWSIPFATDLSFGSLHFPHTEKGKLELIQISCSYESMLYLYDMKQPKLIFRK
jgi:hypothetical protein